jgi:hypothetical protein
MGIMCFSRKKNTFQFDNIYVTEREREFSEKSLHLALSP